MKDMPPSVKKWYLEWIREHPASFHPYDVGRFYIFLHMLFRYAKKPRSSTWLEENLREDCPLLDEDDIHRYTHMYQVISDFVGIWRDHQGQLVLDRIMRDRLKRAGEETDRIIANRLKEIEKQNT